MQQTPVLLSRDCEAIQIPYGNAITARAGTQLTIVHQLGDSITVRTDHGYLLRIDGTDADAMGLDPIDDATATTHAEGPVEESQLWDALKSCFDPEIPANIVELGLVYSCTPLTRDDGTQRVEVKMTLTAPGCGMGQVLKDDVEKKIMGLPNVAEVAVELVFDPPWDPTMMSEAARLQLGMM